MARHLESVFKGLLVSRRAKLMSGRKCCCTWPVAELVVSHPPGLGAGLVLWPTGLCHRWRIKVPLAGWTKRRSVMPPGLRVVKSHLIWWRSSMWMSQRGGHGSFARSNGSTRPAYHAAVRRGYQEQAESEPETHVLIDAARSLIMSLRIFLASSGPDLGAQVFNQIRHAER